MLKHSLTHLIVKFDTKLDLHFLILTIVANKKIKKMSVLLGTAYPFLHKFFKFTLWRWAQLLRNFIRLERRWKNFIKLRYYNFCRRQHYWALWNLIAFYPDYDPIRNNIVTVFNRRFSNILIFLFHFPPLANGLGRQATVQKRCWIWQSNSILNCLICLIEFMLKNWDIYIKKQIYMCGWPRQIKYRSITIPSIKWN